MPRATPRDDPSARSASSQRWERFTTDTSLSLVRRGARASFVVASIFVNPTQFGPGEDLSRYPRDLEGDVAKLASVGVDAVFAPAPAEVYPAGEQTRVRVGVVAEPLRGASRPGHFEGVATVVAKLLSIIGPSVAVFGRKDYQQLLVIRRLVRDLFFPVEILAHPIVRETDGLAMSSRNVYLSVEERKRALSLVRGLDAAARRFAQGERRARELERVARELVEPVATSIDYVEARADETLEALTEVGVGARAPCWRWHAASARRGSSTTSSSARTGLLLRDRPEKLATASLPARRQMS